MTIKKITLFVCLFGIIALSYVTYNKERSLITGANLVGIDNPNSNWVLLQSFSGFQTKLDASKVQDGANPNGQNTTVNNGDRISIRNAGLELFPNGTASTSESKITSSHIFRKRSGENIFIRAYGTVIEYYEEGNDTWELLKTGLTSGQKFGFADYNINTDLRSYVYFGNASDTASRWSGAHTIFTQAATSSATVLFVSDTTGFEATGSVIYCGVQIAYTAKTATTFTVVSAHACDNSKGISQIVDVTTTSANPKGNIYLTANNRLWIAGIASTSQAVYFSQYGVATNFVGANLITDSTDTSPGIFNLGEGGGGVVGMTMDENSIYIFKQSIIYKATLTDSTYVITPLKTFDGKSQTVGAKNNESIFAGGNGIFFITPDNQIMNLARVENYDYPQSTAISDVIKPTVDSLNFNESVGIVFRDKAYFSVKSDNEVTKNDTVLVWNIKTNSWDSPTVGWNVQTFNVYNDGTSDELYAGSSATTNTYKVISTPLDDIYSVKASWRSKQFNFGMPQSKKQIDNLFIEGYIAPNTTLTISLLLDENGFNQVFTTDILGTEDDILFGTSDYNVFGLSPFGFERFGSNDDISGKKKFRVYLNKSFRANPFYTAQLEFASDGENEQWEITNYGFQIKEYTEPYDRKLFRAW